LASVVVASGTGNGGYDGMIMIVMLAVFVLIGKCGGGKWDWKWWL
jgi:hypothetical protein